MQQRQRRKLVDVTGIEPVTPCLQSVNRIATTEYNGLLSCCVFFAFRSVAWGITFLLSTMVSY